MKKILVIVFSLAVLGMTAVAQQGGTNYESLMKQATELPTVEQMVNHETGEYMQMVDMLSSFAPIVETPANPQVQGLLAPLQPLISRWIAAGEKADRMYMNALEQARPIYERYAERLNRGEAQQEYYEEVAPFVRDAVEVSMQVRMKKQLLFAMEIEEEMAKIRTDHPDMAALLPNYPQITASLYFADAKKLLEIPIFH